MRNLGKLRPLPSRRNEKLYWVGYITLSILGLIAMYVLLSIVQIEYEKAISECVDLGNSIEYCEAMLR